MLIPCIVLLDGNYAETVGGVKRRGANGRNKNVFPVTGSPRSQPSRKLYFVVAGYLLEPR